MRRSVIIFIPHRMLLEYSNEGPFVHGEYSTNEIDDKCVQSFGWKTSKEKTV